MSSPGSKSQSPGGRKVRKVRKKRLVTSSATASRSVSASPAASPIGRGTGALPAVEPAAGPAKEKGRREEATPRSKSSGRGTAKGGKKKPKKTKSTGRPKGKRRATSSPVPSSGDNVGVYVRVRPLLPFERRAARGGGAPWQCVGEQVIQHAEGREYVFERVFPPEEDTVELYESVAEPIVRGCLRGLNGTIFAYGQTGSGKTYTMMGDDANPGVIPLAIRQVFETIRNTPESIYLLRCSMMEIYNEQVQDLLDGLDVPPKAIREKDGVFVVERLVERIVTTQAEIMALIAEGNANRSTGNSHLNDQSSRSHAIFRMVIETALRVDDGGDDGTTQPGTPARRGEHRVMGAVRVSELNLVDLAGSEALTDLYGEAQQRETKAINVSLSQLKSVIQALAQAEAFVPYRNSALTKILRQSIGGNAKTCVICNISPTPSNAKQSKMTLLFGSMAKRITNHAVVNETSDDSKAMLKQYRAQINSLTRQLEAFEDIEAQKRKLQRDYERLQQELADLKAREESQNNLNTELSSVAHAVVGSGLPSAVEAAMGVSDAEMDALSRELAAIRLQNARLEADLAAEKEAKAAIAADRQRKMDELQSEKARAHQNLKEIERVRRERDELEAAASDAFGQLSEAQIRAEMRVAEWRDAGVDRDGLLARMIYDYEDDIDRLKIENDDLRSLRTADKLMYEEHLEQAKAMAGGGASQSAALRTAYRRMEAERNASVAELVGLQEELAMYRLQVQELGHHSGMDAALSAIIDQVSPAASPSASPSPQEVAARARSGSAEKRRTLPPPPPTTDDTSSATTATTATTAGGDAADSGRRGKRSGSRLGRILRR